MFHRSVTHLRFATIATGIVFGISMQAHAADIAVFDAAQVNGSGFTFADFSAPGAVDTSAGLISLDISTDSDGVNGLFGGVGADFIPNVDFDFNNVMLETTVRVDAANTASSFNVVLIDVDPNFAGDEFFFSVDLTSAPIGSFVTLTQPLTNPFLVQTAFGMGPGDQIQNYGLKQVQIQSVFDTTDQLVVDVQDIKIVDPNIGLPVVLNNATYTASASQFTFGSMSATGAVDTTGPNIVVDAELQAGGDFPGTSFGGLGFDLPSIDFDAEQAELVVNAKLLANNDAASFNVQLTDSDPGDAGDDFLYTFNTADLNTTDFTELVLPLGDGTAGEILQAFGKTNPGDMLQNFDLTRLQLQSEGVTATTRFNIEIESITIREATTLLGDLDGDGFVGLADLDIILNNWNQSIPPGDPLADPTGDDFVGLADLDIVLNNWNAGTPPSSAAVPEPATLFLLFGGTLALVQRDRHPSS